MNAISTFPPRLPNAETKAIGEWMLGEDQTSAYWRQLAIPMSTTTLAAEIKHHYTTLAESTVPPGVLDDLMRASLARVDWMQLARFVKARAVLEQSG